MTLGRSACLPLRRRAISQRLSRPTVTAGKDPAGEKAEARRELTVGQLCDWYLGEAEADRILGRSSYPIKASTHSPQQERSVAAIPPK